MRQRWYALSVEQRLASLRFEDPPLVHNFVCVQRILQFSGVKCFLLGVDLEIVPEEAGLANFALECAADQETASDAPCPVAFFTREELAVRDDLLEYLASELGRPLPCSRALLRRAKWPSIFQPAPSSWSGFFKQILRVVEQAIIYTCTYDAEAEIGRIVAVAPAEPADTPSATSSRCAKRRLREKRCRANARECALQDEADAGRLDEAGESALRPSPPSSSGMSECRHEQVERLTAPDSTSCSNQASQLVDAEVGGRVEQDGGQAFPEQSRHQSTFGPSMVESDIGRVVFISHKGVDDEVEWAVSMLWDEDPSGGALQDTGIRVVKRNTFLEVVEAKAQSARSRSAPSRARHW